LFFLTPQRLYPCIKISSMISVNANAVRIVEKMMVEKEPLGITSQPLSCGATVLDCTSGKLEAGKLFSEVCMGGLGNVSFMGGDVHVRTDLPLIACMASQYAGWNVKVKYARDGEEKKFSTSGSGPARALSRTEKLFDEFNYKDECDKAVMALEVRDFPREEVARLIAEKCGIAPNALFILFAPTASLVGSVQISARIVEVGLHKLRLLGFDLRRIVSAYGSAPVAPVGKNDMDAMGKTNDCILYGGETYYYAYCSDEEVERAIQNLSSSSSKSSGKPFGKILAEYNYEFYKIDPALFSPATVTINNIKTGKTWRVGRVNMEILEESLYS
jgi:methenyltetrahydromethanopterin cyclohydrolase